jgi:FAD:protein FMN transferase
MAMGTRCDVVLFHDDLDFAERVNLSLQKEVGQCEHLLSRFQAGSPVSRFNAMKPGELFSPGEILWYIIQECKKYNELTVGAFDITSYQVIKLWKDKSPEEKIDEEELKIALAKSGFDKLKFDDDKKTIEKLVEGVELDFGAIGKGLALDIIKKLLIQQNIKVAFISFGESSVLALGKHPAGDYWPVGIPNPYAKQEMLHVFNVVDGFVTTSGTIINTDREKIGSRMHIIDPRNGNFIIPGSLVSVKSPTAAMGEVISTSWMIMDDDQKEELKKEIKNIEIYSADFAGNKLEKNFLIDL